MVDRAAEILCRAAMAAGGKDTGPPGARKHQFTPVYHAAFGLGPDGNNIEAVCRGWRPL